MYITGRESNIMNDKIEIEGKNEGDNGTRQPIFVSFKTIAKSTGIHTIGKLSSALSTDNLRYLKFKPMHAHLTAEKHREKNVKSCLFFFFSMG